jgi:hypothetical protein
MTKRSSSGMPKMRAAFRGWTSRITLLKHRETVVDGFVKRQEVAIYFYGTIQPLDPRSLALKPEGQRSWSWLQIHCQVRATTLIPGDRVTWNNDVYKVMDQIDYSLNGYMEYHLVRDFQDAGRP